MKLGQKLRSGACTREEKYESEEDVEGYGIDWHVYGLL